MLTLFGASAPCSAHPASVADARVVIEPDGYFRLTVTCDILAYALNELPARVADAPMNELLDGPLEVLQQRLDDARERFGRDITLGTGPQPTDHATIDALHFPAPKEVYRWRDSGTIPRLPVRLEAGYTGHLPPGTRSVVIKFPEVLGFTMLTVERPGAEPYCAPLEDGQPSEALSLVPQTKAPAAKGPPIPPPSAVSVATTPQAAAVPVGSTAAVAAVHPWRSLAVSLIVAMLALTIVFWRIRRRSAA